MGFILTLVSYISTSISAFRTLIGFILSSVGFISTLTLRSATPVSIILTPILRFATPDGFHFYPGRPYTAQPARIKIICYTCCCLLYTSDAADEEDSVD